MRSFVAIAVGAVLLIAAAAGFIIVPEHAPSLTLGYSCPTRAPGVTNEGLCVHQGLSQTVYDALRIATWAALILGVLVAATGLIWTARARPEVTADRR
jgi:hypothetical protein